MEKGNAGVMTQSYSDMGQQSPGVQCTAQYLQLTELYCMLDISQEGRFQAWLPNTQRKGDDTVIYLTVVIISLWTCMLKYA